MCFGLCIVTKRPRLRVANGELPEQRLLRKFRVFNLRPSTRAAESKRDTEGGNAHTNCPASIRPRQYCIKSVIQNPNPRPLQQRVFGTGNGQRGIIILLYRQEGKGQVYVIY